MTSVFCMLFNKFLLMSSLLFYNLFFHNFEYYWLVFKFIDLPAVISDMLWIYVPDV